MYLIRFEVLEDLKRGGCPICSGTERTAREWLRGLLRDIDDARVRANLERSGGICPPHIRLLVEVADDNKDSLGLGVVLEFLLAAAERTIARASHRVPVRASRRRGALKALTTPRCGVCDAEARRIDAYLEFLLDSSDGEVSRYAGDRRGALCLVHLSLAMARAQDRQDSTTVRLAARRKLEELKAQVNASIRAHAVGSAASAHVHDVLKRDAPQWLAGGPSGSRSAR